MGWILLFLLALIVIRLRERRKLRASGGVSLMPVGRAETLATTPIKKKSPRTSFRADGINLAAEQLAVFKVLESSSHNIFITGKAGSGKSVLLKYFKDNTKKASVTVAPTGIAALNVGGQTIHSLFKIKQGFIDKSNPRIDQQTTTTLKHIDALIIDEVSMVRADLMDAIDHSLRQARQSKLAFGGVQVIMFGDLYQLPPIVGDAEHRRYFIDKYGGYFFFNAKVWQNTSLETHELTRLFRQRGKKFRDILNAIRSGKIDSLTLDELNKRAEVALPKTGVVTLAATNKLVDEINSQRLEALTGKEYVYRAMVDGKLRKSEYLAESKLRLKVGAQVIMLRNDKDRRWVNGSLGEIKSLGQNRIEVKIGKRCHEIEPVTWTKIRYSYNQSSGKVEEQYDSSITQYPVRLAWAITIHKSQGQTYDCCAIDLKDGVFAHGQAYVALSRCRSISGLYLLSPILSSDISLDPQVVKFMTRAKPFKALSLGINGNFSK